MNIFTFFWLLAVIICLIYLLICKIEDDQLQFVVVGIVCFLAYAAWSIIPTYAEIISWFLNIFDLCIFVFEFYLSVLDFFFSPNIVMLFGSILVVYIILIIILYCSTR